MSAAMAGGALAVLRGADDDVALPPVEETELTRAADAAGCVLHRGGRPPTRRPRIEGARAKPIAGGIYSSTPSQAGLVGAMREGAVVVRFRPGLDDADREQLEELQRSLPKGTILTPDAEMPYAVAATAWRRLLGCERGGDDTLDAIRLFQGRYVGQGPEASG